MNLTNGNFYATSLARPQSYITKGKQRLKQHTDTVYLKNGDEFEIELFNPTNNKVLAKIELNGKSIGAGIILRPGERVFLERYLDEAKKFLFETYVVNGDDNEVKRAIANNGDVAVKFFDERTSFASSSITINNPLGNWSTNTGTIQYTPITYTGGNNVFYSSSSIGSGMVNGTLTTSSTSYAAPQASINANLSQKTRSLGTETGRVEKGSDSTQSFSYDNSQFNSWASTTNWWKIKPQSTKPVVKEDLVTYCTECGSKRKKDNHKFCPHCGTKF